MSCFCSDRRQSGAAVEVGQPAGTSPEREMRREQAREMEALGRIESSLARSAADQRRRLRRDPFDREDFVE